MILQFKENTTALNYSLYLLELYETPPKGGLFYYDYELVYQNVNYVFINSFTNYKANHDNLIIWYNLRLKLVAIDIHVKDYMLIPKELREQLEEITHTQLIHLFGSGD